ncbi:D-threo-aldose 1-dehydrogenase [Allocatelliglobosispora scoriae]|uniref:D-threo-aldose 1-dehydrogenase n=1 Tax=Allocatelliglobosispora scoriae TaxID=643052 RepID=A0A841C5C7_9ACTN|nr:aldo/keto reductase [Allocatelliglobosispora scoriae]MBB5874499.1 D-threo-aldose 1-dehydrogenase [Allocatelliglobosispora scoriae]
MRADDVVPLGRTGIGVSRLGLGLASIGGLFEPVAEEQAIATVDAAWDAGLRLFDTAPVYGYGRSETRTGLALRHRTRDDFVLCTKVGRLIEADGPDTQAIWADPPPGVGPRLDYSYPAVIRSVEESLDRLGLDRIDILHIHDPDQDYPTALRESYRALADLRAAGVIRAVSLGVNHADVAARFLREAASPGLDCVLLAGRYSLFDQSGLDELLPLCAERDLGVMIAGVFQSGLLAEPRTGAAYGYDSVPASVVERVRLLRAACARFGVPPLALALRFPLAHPAVSCVVVGARAPHEIAETAALLDHPIPGGLWAELTSAGLLPAAAPTGE